MPTTVIQYKSKHQSMVSVPKVYEAASICIYIYNKTLLCTFESKLLKHIFHSMANAKVAGN